MESNGKFKVYRDTVFNGNTNYMFLTFFFFLIGSVSIFLTVNLDLYNKSLFNDTAISFGAIVTIIAGIIILIALLILITFILKKQKRSFYLYDDRISTKYKNEIESEIFFKDIYEVYKFRKIDKNLTVPFGITDCLAYRKDREEPWFVIIPTLKEKLKKNKGSELCEKIIDGYVKNKLPVCLDNINNGKVITFEYLVDDNKNRRDKFDKSLYALSGKQIKKNSKLESTKNYCKANIHKIILLKDSVIYNEQKINLDHDDIINEYDIEVEWEHDVKKSQKGKILEILDKDNNQKLKINLTCLVNSDLFLALIHEVYKGLKISEEQKEITEEV